MEEREETEDRRKEEDKNEDLNRETDRENQQDPEITLDLILDYLEELRRHLMIPIGILILTFILSVPFSKKILEIFLYPFREIIPDFVFIKPFESFWVHIKASLYLSLIISAPFFIWRIWLFISPALYHRERKLASTLVFVVTFLFIVGTLFGYFLVLPASLKFLIESFSSEKIKAMITISEFVSFCLKFSLAFGLSFQTPVIIVLLTKTGLVQRETLIKIRPYAVVFAFIISAIITPTPDAFTQVALAIPLIVLWEIGILASKFI